MADQVGHLLLVGASGRACGAAAIQAKNACLTAPHSLFLPPAPAAAAPNARPPHTPRQHRQTGAGSRTSSPPAAAIQRPASIPVIPGLTGNLLPRGIIPAYPSCPTLCCHGRPFAVMADLIGHLPPRGTPLASPLDQPPFPPQIQINACFITAYCSIILLPL